MPDPVREFEAYRDALLALLGGDDPIDVLARTPKLIEDRLAGIDEAVLERRPRQGARRQQMGHRH